MAMGLLERSQVALRRATEQERYEGYQAWQARQLSHPRLAAIRYLWNDIRSCGHVSPEAWRLFNDDRRTMVAESLSARHTTVDHYNLDGADVVVSEATAGNSRITLRSIYQNGLQVSQEQASRDNGYKFQARRDELFLQLYQEVEAMLQGKSQCDTIAAVSTLPSDADPSIARKLMYDLDGGKSFLYVFRRMPGGQLEMSATTLYQSNLAAHAALLRFEGQNNNVPFELLTSHEYGNYTVRLNTADEPLEHVVSAFVKTYDHALQESTDRKHNHGRTDQSIDAYTLFGHTAEYWAIFNNYYEMLAGHLAGRPLADELRRRLAGAIERQQSLCRQGKSAVLEQEELARLSVQVACGTITFDMVMACDKLLMYSHIGQMDALLREYNAKGSLASMQESKQRHGNAYDAYSSSANDAGYAAAASGRSFGGCGVEFGVSQSGLSTAMATAAKNGTSLEEELRRLTQEQGKEIECTCPFCDQKVVVDPCAKRIECPECEAVVEDGKVKSYGKVHGRRKVGGQAVAATSNPAGREPKKAERSVPSSGSRVVLNKETFVVGRRVVLGGIEFYLVDKNGEIAMSGKQAEGALGLR